MVESSTPVVTIDGPGGSGKGTVCRALATRFGWAYLDSGALYRLVGLAAHRRGVALDDEPALAALAGQLDVVFNPDPASDESGVLLDGLPVGDQIRTEESGDAASRVAVLPGVRAALLARQRAFRTGPGLVADGRDMGTVVFPEATLKIYLTAAPEERAERRYKQLKEKGMDASLAALLKDIIERDRRDAERTHAPLKPAADALQIDSTHLSIDEVVEEIAMQTEKRLDGNW